MIHRKTVLRSAILTASSALIATAFAGCGSDGNSSTGPNEVSGGAGGSSASGGTSSGGSSADGGTSSGGSSGTSSGGGGGFLTGGNGGGAADGGGGSGGLDPDSGCASSNVQGDLVPANVLFVVDRSGSMNCNLPQDGQTTAECDAFPQKEDPSKPSKWELTRDALKQALDALEAQGNISVGVSMFPKSQSACDLNSSPNVTIASLDATFNSSVKAFFDTVSPGGSTPLVGATILGYDYMWSQKTSGATTGNDFVILITDGFETCIAENVRQAFITQLISQDVPTALSVDMRTFVIGVPGSEDGRATLSQIANEGGTGTSPSCDASGSAPNVGDCHFDMTTSSNFAQDLANALEQISGSLLGCEFDVPQNPSGGAVDLNRVNVELNGNPINKNDMGNCSDPMSTGWDYNSNQTKILLCGTDCEAAKQPNSSVEIVLGCPTVVQ